MRSKHRLGADCGWLAIIDQWVFSRSVGVTFLGGRSSSRSNKNLFHQRCLSSGSNQHWGIVLTLAGLRRRGSGRSIIQEQSYAILVPADREDERYAASSLPDLEGDTQMCFSDYDTRRSPASHHGPRISAAATYNQDN